MRDETKRLAITGAKWISLGFVLKKLLNALIVIILARLLTPSDFGAAALAVVVLSVLIAVKELGMSNALIQRREAVEETANAFFFVGLGLTLPLYVLVFATAPWIAAFFAESDLTVLLRILGLQLIAETIAAVPRTMAVRQLMTREQFLVGLAESLLNGVVAVTCALFGLGALSLILGILSGAFGSAFLWWGLVPWRPTFRLDREVTWRSLSFGSTLAVASAVDTAADGLGRLFVGRFLGVTAVGYYDLATRLVFLPLRALAIALGQRVLLPAFSQIQKDAQGIRRWYLETVRHSVLLLAPLSLFLAAAGDLLARGLLGQKWSEAAPLVQILSPFAVLIVLLSSRPIFTALGEARTALKLTAWRLTGGALALYWAAQFSLKVLCATEIIVIGVFSLISLVWVARLIALGLAELWPALRVPLEAAACAGLALLAVRLLLLPRLEPAPDLGLAIAASVLTLALYTIAVLLTGRRAAISDLTALARLLLEKGHKAGRAATSVDQRENLS